MDDAIIESHAFAALVGANPWWHHDVVEALPFRRVAYETSAAWLTRQPFVPAMLLSGPRGVGKTTVLIQIAATLIERGANPTAIAYLPLDHPVLGMLSLERLVGLFRRSIAPRGAPVILLVDEIAYAKGGERALAKLSDPAERSRVLATTSTRLGEPVALASPAAGRVAHASMTTLSFHEDLAMRDAEVPDLTDRLAHTDLFRLEVAARAPILEALAPLEERFHAYLAGGGFPGHVRHAGLSTVRRGILEGGLRAALGQDAGLLFGLRNGKELAALLVYLCANAGELLSIHACAEWLGTTTVTVRSHLDMLERAHLVRLLPQLGADDRPLSKRRYTVQLVDAAVGNALMAWRGYRWEAKGPLRMATQSAILRHLAAFEDRSAPEVGYWRDPRSGRTVDFAVRTAERVIPVTVEVAQPPRMLWERDEDPEPEQGPDETALAAYCRAEPRVRYAYRVSLGGRTLETRRVHGSKARILHVPAHVLAYLIGQAERRRARA